MFKLESYITPVILSYVEKYVKNFKPEQSQVSLWGGDASFQNLDLRLEVLEEQLNLPFTFVSGHIHELLIHVPWVKITSEPIVVTINTIECVLKLKENQSENVSSTAPPKQIEIPQEEAPHGYIKSIITKVINNITINCNNLILKYVEEDIVLSINVRLLSMQTVNNKWEPAFIDINSYEMKLQKTVTIQDLTLCLDKMDTSGKIETYQDPVLYRCSMVIRLIMSYHSSTAKRASITRFDLHCQKMEFSITEQQIPMIMRLALLFTLLQSRQFSTAKEKPCISNEESKSTANVDELTQVTTSAEDSTWGMWVWNTMSAVLPIDWDNEWSNEQNLVYSGHVMHFGFYVDDATITFKTVESVKEQLFYKSRKIKYKSFLTLRFSDVIFDAILQGIEMTNFIAGFGSINFYPRGSCSCGYLEVVDGVQPPLYLVAGKKKSNHLKDTLFDSDTIENQGKKRVYKKDISYHLNSNPVSVLLEKCPAFCMDYIHYTEIPDDITPENMAEFGSSYEYSNFHEERYTRYVIGNLTIRLCSGLFHRFDTIIQAANKYDYSPYITPKPAPSFNELPPVTVEEYDALRDNIPVVKMHVYMKKTAIQLQLADHRVTGLPRPQNYIESRTEPLMPALSDDPFLNIECDVVSVTLEQPLYPFRVIACASKQSEIPTEMLSHCYRDIKAQLQGIGSQIYLKSYCHTSIVMPCHVEYNLRMLLYPLYWKNLNILHNSHNLKVDSITLTGTKRKIIAAYSIVTSLLYPDDASNSFICSSLYTDSCEEKNPIFIEVCLENISHNGEMAAATVSCITNINAVKIFTHNETQQAFILSGPESEDQDIADNQMLATAVVQFSRNSDIHKKNPAILLFRIAPMKGCIDPLLLQWLDYRVTYYKLNTADYSTKSEIANVNTESVISDTGGKKRTFPSLHESVHSSSDKERKRIEITEKFDKKSVHKTNESDKIFLTSDNAQEKGSRIRRLTEFYPWWSILVLSGSIDHIIIYIPTKTMSCIGAEGVEHAKKVALRNDKSLQILAVKFPIINIHSSNIQPNFSLAHFSDLPIILPREIWTSQTHSFPWKIEILDFESFTLKGSSQRNFIKKICFKSTLDLTIKNSNSDSLKTKPSTLSLCLYIDTSPIIVSISDDQVVFLSNIFTNIVNTMKKMSPRKDNKSNSCTKEVKDITFAVPRSSSSPTQLFYTEDATTTSTISAIKETTERDDDDTHLTACIQWTITKMALKLYVMGECEYASLKLVLELEDIITSVDMQSVYLKLKHKITSAAIFHYARDSPSHPWDFGDYVGLVLCAREDNYEKNEDSGFLSLTLTVAKSGNVHTRWAGRKTYKIPRRDIRTEALQPMNRFIVEVLVKVQMLDIIIPPSVFIKYIRLIKPFLSRKSLQANNSTTNAKNNLPSFVSIANLRNETLPLIYLEFQGFRLMIPDASQNIQESQHDLLMLQLDGIRINPHAENPICRVPLRPDIYQLAAQANILSVPGSAVEDRQYQININGICVHTTTWKDYQQSVVKQMSQSYLYTMNENPAVEWNKLGHGSSLEPHFSTLPVITRFDFCFIVAPAIVLKPDTLVCASAVEINCLTDLEMIVNLNQIKLVTSLCTQFKNLIPFHEPVESKVLEIPSFPRQTSLLSNRKSSYLTKQSTVESETDFAKDSGVDFDIFSINSTNHEKPVVQETSEHPPFELLINCGKITMIVYEIKKVINSKSELNTFEVKEDDINNLKQPLFYAMINQPNLYFSQQYYDQKIQVSCFDVALLLGDEADQNLGSLPSESDFKICLIETRSGEPHPDTGIPPSFLVIKYEVFVGKNSQLNISIGRPSKIHFSLSRLSFVKHIKDKILESLISGDLKSLASKCRNEEISLNIDGSGGGGSSNSSISNGSFLTHDSLLGTKPRKYNLADINLTSCQVVLSFKCDDSEEPSAESLLSVASITGSLSSGARPERIYGNLSWDSLLVSTRLGSRTMLLLNPCCGSGTLGLGWESWQSSLDLTSAPHLQLQAEIDCLYLDFGPRHVLALKALLADYQRISEMLLSPDSTAPPAASPGDGFGNSRKHQEPVATATLAVHEQHYKDDLKSGAFQFVDGNVEELPFPYQVVFFSSPQAMAWRYPHPRALTKVHVNPVPFETYQGTEGHEEASEDQVACALEYWSETQTAYQRYVEFYLSETESYRLDLPDKPPLQAVACIWRIVLLDDSGEHGERRPRRASFLSSKALLACMRVDSYFNPRIVPVLQAALNVRAFQLRLYNHLEASGSLLRESLPAPLLLLADYKLSGMVPESQCFALLEHKRASLVFNKWPDGSLLLRLSGDVAVHLLDYGLLILQNVLDSLDFKFQASIGPELSLDLSLLTTRPFSLKLSPSVFHTLASSAHLWNNLLLPCPKRTEATLVLTTRYVIANDTNVPIRFGQSATDDNILLESRQCYFYSWRHANNQVLRIAVEENGWSWSKAFPVNNNGTYEADFNNSSLDIVISINVTSLSATQKLVTFSGQLVISNQLADNIEVKLVKYDAITNNKSTLPRNIFQISANARAPSIVFIDNKSMAMRLRFSSIPNMSWTGDIPLQPNARWGQPWLVKVPLQEKGQFISIWVRIIIEQVNGKNKILAIISPLYMIRSYLPVPAKVKIETPSLKVSLNTIINGRGEKQQLYCPGTFEHFHQLTFQIESGVSASNPYVPLSYGSVDQRKFFKRPEKESIKDILKTLESTKEESKWPFQSDSLYSWTAADQPQTHVQVKYEDAGLASSTLLLELQPWCFILNSLGTQISLVSQDVELCRIPHYGVVAPPKLEGIFHVGVNIAGVFYLSPPLQLVKSEWSQGFYMPRIEGLIPLEGNIKVCIDCHSSTCTISVSSSIKKDMRIIRISSNYVIGNMTNYELKIATLAVPNSLTNSCLPNDLTSRSINILPSIDQSYAIPIIQWHTLFEKNDESCIFYISLRLDNKSWSCPVRVDEKLSRKCIALPNGKSTIPLVVTTQEDKSTIYITVHIDKHPQLYIENMCSFNIVIGQASEESGNITPETQHFDWKCQVGSNSSCHYSMPTFGNQLPDLANNNNDSFSMLISALPINEDFSNASILQWSKGVSLTAFPLEQFVRLPHYGDVKLIMQRQCYTTCIRFTPISQIEISAQEIRCKIQKKYIPNEDKIDLASDYSFTCLDDEKIPLNQQSTSSSTSTTTFFSAQDEISEIDLLASPTKIVTGASNDANQINRTTTVTEELSTVSTYRKKKFQNGSIVIHLQGFSIVIMKDVNDNAQRIEVANLCLTDTICMMDYKNSRSNLSIYIGDLQLDNQMFEQGGFDFPVVLISQKQYVKKVLAICLTNNLKSNIKNIVENSLLSIDLVWENNPNTKVCKEVAIKISPISAYIEGAFITLLIDYSTLILPPCFTSLSSNPMQPITIGNDVYIPDHILFDAKILSQPLRIESFMIEPLSILLSVHTSVHIYVAFDHSPLFFDAFYWKNLITTPYRLGNALAMHYLSGAIFGVGWVVGSLEILGSPGGLAQALGTGLKDFISMPFQGLLQGPWGFIVGITHGSASLVKHITAGTVNSVTKLASSVARNLDRLTLDDEHLQRQEEFRRMRPQGLAQGLYQGLTGFGMSLLAAIAGLAHHPLQQVWSGEASTRGLVTGVGRGLVGVVTKPLSGAAELVALTGQGLLQGTGWISMPSQRQRPVLQYSNGSGVTSLRYTWRLMSLLAKNDDSILHVSNADYVMLQGSNSRAVSLVLTKKTLLIVNIAEDSVEKILPLKDITAVDNPSESTVFRLYCSIVSPIQQLKKVSPVEQVAAHMDREMRARVAEFLRTSSTGMTSVSTNSDAESESDNPISLPESENSITFYISSDSRSYLLSIFNMAKSQSQGNGFPVI